MTLPKHITPLLLVSVPLVLAGCGGLQPSSEVKSTVVPLHMQGKVHGGQQPISGATIQLYAVGTDYDGENATPLISSTVLSGPDGGFDATGTYTCPSATSLVYLTAAGGNSGSGTNNTGSMLMSALGQCGNLPGTYISVNEVSTVASVFALAPYMSSVSSVGSSTYDAFALSAAFGQVDYFVNTATGQVPGPALPSYLIAPATTIYSLADIAASCVNSAGGTANDGSPCGNLFLQATPSGGSAPTNTVDALLAIAQTPTQNVAQIFNLIPSSPPFQPTLSSAPASWAVVPTQAVASPATYSVCTTWGDSLTAGNEDGSGITIATTLAGLGSCNAVYNEGAGGQTSTQIAIRQGGVLTTATIAGGTIPASGPVGISFPTGYEVGTSQGPGNIDTTINGVEGAVSYNSADSTQAFTRYTAGAPVSSPANSPITVNTGNLNTGFNLIWVGRNNYHGVAQVLSDVAGMVANLPAPKHFLILSVINSEYAFEWNTCCGDYHTMLGLNNALAETYPGNYLDIREMVVNQYDPNNAGDVLDHSHDVPPSSYRAIDYSGTLSAAIDASTCDINPDPGYAYVLLIDQEKILMATGDFSANCTRGWGGTTPAAHAAGTYFRGIDDLHLNGPQADAYIGNVVENWIKQN